MYGRCKSPGILKSSLWYLGVAQSVKNLPAMWETWVRSLSWEDPLKKGMATHSSILAWRIPWTEEPGRLQSMGLKDWTWLSDFHFLSFGVLCFPTLSPSGYTLAGSCSGWGLGVQPICLPVPSGSLLRAAIAAWWHDVWSVLYLLIMAGNIFHPQQLLSVSSLGERVLFLPLFKKPLIPPSWWDPSSWPYLTLITS